MARCSNGGGEKGDAEHWTDRRVGDGLRGGPVQPASAAPTLSVSLRLAPAGTPLVIAGAGCAAGEAVSVRLEGPIVPPGPGGPTTVLPAVADADGAWSLTTSMPAGTVSVAAVCGLEFSGGVVISSDFTTHRGIDAVWIDDATASLTLRGGLPASSVEVLTPAGQVIGQLVFDGSGVARGQLAVPPREVQLFGLGREFLLSEFPSPAAWRGDLPPRPAPPPTTTATAVSGAPSTVPGGNGATTAPVGPGTSVQVGPGTAASVSRPSDRIPETGAASTSTAISVALGCCAAGASIIVATRRSTNRHRAPRRPTRDSRS